MHILKDDGASRLTQWHMTHRMAVLGQSLARQTVCQLGLAVCCLFLTACGPQGPQEEKKKDTSIPVEVTYLKRGSIESVLEASSNLEAESEVQVPARTANRVKTLLVEEGDEVKAGDLLVQLENDIQIIQVSKAKNQVAEAKEEFERQQSLHSQDLISDQVFSQAKFNLQQLQLNLEDAERELGYTEIRAPIPGTITLRQVKVGDQVTAGQNLFNIIDFQSIVARLYIPENELSHIRVRQPVRVESTAFPGQSFQGHILRVAPIVESRSGMIKVTVGFKDVGPLLPGMYVDADIVIASKPDALLLPKKAFVYDGEQRFVFRMGEDRMAERILPRTGLEDSDHVEPLDQLSEGDAIVIAGQTGLKDGSKVRLPEDPEFIETETSSETPEGTSTPEQPEAE